MAMRVLVRRNSEAVRIQPALAAPATTTVQRGPMVSVVFFFVLQSRRASGSLIRDSTSWKAIRR